jgi:hypothetical protein
MTPIGAGGLGYLDYQRTVNWDGPLLFSAQEKLLQEGQEYGNWDVSRYASLLARLEVFTNPIKVNLAWSTAGGPFSGLSAVRQFVLDPNILAPLQLLIPNLGPTVNMTTTTPVLQTAKLTANIHGSNRVSVLPFLAIKPHLLNVAHAFPVAGSFKAYPNSYYAGPAKVRAFASEATGFFLLEAEIEPNEWVFVESWETAAGAVKQLDILLPGTAWRINMETLAKGEASLTITPALTGST